MKCGNHPRWEENINYIFEGAIIGFYFSPFDSYSSYRVNIPSTSFIQSVWEKKKRFICNYQK